MVLTYVNQVGYKLMTNMKAILPSYAYTDLTNLLLAGKKDKIMFPIKKMDGLSSSRAILFTDVAKIHQY